MRHHLTLFYALLHLGLAAQNGPAGVGTAANNVLWLRADNGVNQTGGFVDTWNDRSGNNNHAALAHATNYSLWVNGRTGAGQ